ncbi:MAG: hypothetical protein M3327_05435 [Actinomycetota bacterium]|nr:hypothetical protein [Actinomycetota bacterium]
MAQPKSPARGNAFRLVLFALMSWAFIAVTRNPGGEARREESRRTRLDRTCAHPSPPSVDVAPRPARKRGRRLALSLAFATLFFAALAFSGAGEILVQPARSDATCEETDASQEPGADLCASEPAAGEETDAGEEASATEPADQSEPDDQSDGSVDPVVDTESGADPVGQEDGVPAAPETTAPDAANAGGEIGGTHSNLGGTGAREGGSAEAGNDGPSGKSGQEETANAGNTHAPSASPLYTPPAVSRPRTLDPEATAAGSAATVWLHRTLADPTPAARRLAPAFAKNLRAESRRVGVEWALVLAVLRAEGKIGRWPADRAGIREVATRLRTVEQSAGSEWKAFLGLRGRTTFADRSLAFTRYNRAVGLRSLVTGLEGAKKRLEHRVLADERLDIYAGGRGDVEAGRVDVRVLVLLRYLAEAYRHVTISSLQTGHRLYARPGVVSAHAYGLAVDVAALNGKPILGNSAPGGLTEGAVRAILLLPAELRPQQVISLLGLGGPSFPLANHADHIHVGY